MKLNVAKLFIFAVLLGCFYSFDGFKQPQLSGDDYRSKPKIVRAWAITVILFVSGAMLALWGNQIAEHADWDIPAGFYPILGVILLAAGFVWKLMVRDAGRL